MGRQQEEQALALFFERLQERFPGLDAETINGEVARLHQRFNGSRIRDFLPILIEREAVDHFAKVPQQRVPESSG
jgi:hypothetical protein